MNEFSKQVEALSRSNGWQVAMVRLKLPTTTADTFEILLEPKGKEQMEALARRLENEKPYSPFE